MSTKIRIAIVEDNATARTTIRSHLLPLGNVDISSFSSGNELKGALRKQHFELLIFDFHLEQKRNGVEWVQLLRDGDFIRPSTGIIFITADRAPQTIGQIIDIHPDLLILKPYTIAILQRGVKHYLEFRELISQVLSSLDNSDEGRAVELINKIKGQVNKPKFVADLDKLHARLLLQNGLIPEAKALYENVLARSEKVLWAQWGKLKCEYFLGNWLDCKDALSDMVATSLTKDKAFEWLASLSFEQHAYDKAEFYLDHINFSDLSLPATKLKSMTYQKQNRVIEGIDLLNKKREFNRTTRERFDEFTYELAEFYLGIAEHTPSTQRQESISQARKLIGIASRHQADPQLLQRQDFLLAYGHILVGENDKANNLIQRDHMTNYTRTGCQTLICAAKVHRALGNSQQVQDLLTMAERKVKHSDTIVEQLTVQTHLLEAQQRLGLASEKAKALNEKGLVHFTRQQYVVALDHFYQACRLDSTQPTYHLNLLQCLLQSEQSQYRSITLYGLIQQLQQAQLEGPNQSRFRSLAARHAEQFNAPPASDVPTENAQPISDANESKG